MTERKKIRVSDIAEMAGVSQATVSKVLNGRDDISEETRTRIEKILRQNGYSKSRGTARTSQTVELVVRHMENDGTFGLLRNALDCAQDMGIGITVTQTGTGRQARKTLRQIAARNPIGVILLMFDLSGGERYFFDSRNIPFVMLDPLGDIPTSVLSVSVDNWKGGYDVTRHLIALGHRRIGVITGPRNSQTSLARYAGYRAAMDGAGIDIDEGLTAEGDFVDGHTPAHKLLALPDPPTAIFAFNDLMAVGVYKAARELGLALPRDLSVAGFDNVYPSAHLFPSLTTVDQPFDQLTRTAITMLMQARSGTVDAKYVILPTTLVIRDSTVTPRTTETGPEQ